MAQIKLTVATDIKAAQSGIKNLKAQIEELSQSLSSVSVNNNFTKQLNALSKYYKELASAGEKATKTISGGNSAMSASFGTVETLRKGFANLLSQIKTLQGQYPAQTFDEVAKKVNVAYGEIKELSKAFESNSGDVDENKKKAAQLSQTYKTLSADVAALKQANTKLSVSNPFSTSSVKNLDRLRAGFANLQTQVQNVTKYYKAGTFDTVTASIKQNEAAVNALYTEWQNTGTLSAESMTKLNGLNTALLDNKAAFAEAKAGATNYHGSLVEMIQGFLQWNIAATVVMQAINLVRNAFADLNETLVETEDAIVAIQRVLDEDVSSSTISDELYQIAINLGQSFDNVQEIAQNFAKAGLSWQETLEATEAAVLALNVAELTATESSEGLIAVMQQFNLEASELTDVIDLLNKAADKSAVDTADLLTALEKVGSYASAANLELSETIALISAISEATAASGSNIGNALKSLLSYTTQSDALDTFASLSTDMSTVVSQYRLGAASILDVWEQLSIEMQSLSAEQANLLSEWTEDSGLESELSGELSDIYETLTGVYDTAGTYRKNYFIALLNNFDEVGVVLDELSDAAGYTMSEQEKYMETYTAKVTQLNTQWEYLLNEQQSFLELKKGLVDFANWILKLVEWTGGLRTTLIALSTILWTVFGSKIIASIKSFASSLSLLVTGFKTAATAAQTFQAALGWIGLAATIVSALVGLIESAADAAKQLQEEAIADGATAQEEYAESISEITDSYDELIDKIKDAREVLDSETSTTEDVENAKSELLTIQNQLIESNSEYADSVDLVNGSLTEQLNLLSQMNEEQLRQQVTEYLTENSDSIRNAQKYLSEEIGSITFDDASENGGFWDVLFEDTTLEAWLKSKGYSAEAVSGWEAIGSMFTNSSVWNTELYSSGTRTEQLELLEQLREQAVAEQAAALEEYQETGNEALDNFSKELITDRYDSIIASLTTAIKSIENDETYQNALAIINGDSSASGFASLSAQTLKDFVNGTISYEEFMELLLGGSEDTNDSIDDTNDALDKTAKKLEDISSTQSEIAEKLKAINDESSKAAELEEKRLALEEARNQRGSWVLNDETGNFEWMADQAAIDEAQAELDEYLSDEAWDAVITELEEGTATNESILAILEEWSNNATSSGGSNAFVKEIIAAIYAASGIDLSGGSYDSGGIASGMGYLAKATAANETVNDPDLTAKILSPTSNAQFDQYVKDMGILFETAQAYATQSPSTVSTVGNTYNQTYNNGATINGVKVGSDMMNRSLGEVLSMVGLVASK